MTDQTKQTEAQAIAEPIIEETIARLSNAGLTGPEIAQAMILTGAGLLAGSLGPKHAGFAMRDVADKAHAWMLEIAEQIENR